MNGNNKGVVTVEGMVCFIKGIIKVACLFVEQPVMVIIKSFLNPNLVITGIAVNLKKGINKVF